jgi:hypothetical protein
MTRILASRVTATQARCMLTIEDNPSGGARQFGKPVQLVADATKDVSPRGSVVLDLFGGSGSTLIAAHKTGRRAYLCEYDPQYCDRFLTSRPSLLLGASSFTLKVNTRTSEGMCMCDRQDRRHANPP